MEPLPSRSALVRIGKALAAGTETDGQLDQLGVLLARADDVQARTADRFTEVLNDVSLDSGGRLSVRGRAKTLVTLQEKLVRMGGHQLPVIRDLAGLRIIGDMTLDEQDHVLLVAAGAVGLAEGDVKVIDRRAEPVRGYRALHGELVVDGVRAEVQVRTTLQHQWAELSERAADHYGRSMRYPEEAGAAPALGTEGSSILEVLEMASEVIAAVEGADWRLARRRLLDQLPTDSDEHQLLRPSGPGADPVEEVSRLEQQSSELRQQASHILNGLNRLLARDTREGRR